MRAGVIAYRSVPGGLRGEWTHADAPILGAVASEDVRGASITSPTGAHSVVIRLPDGTTLFTGLLTIVTLGEAFRMTWRGQLLLPTRRSAIYDGVGLYLAQERLIVASFEEVTAPG